MTLIPYFEVNGNRYEIRRSRYLVVEFEKIRESSNIGDDESKEFAKLQDKAMQLDKLKIRSDELFDAYLETLTDEAHEAYEKVHAEYEKLFDEVAPSFGKEGLITRIDKTFIDNAEKLVITALQRDESGKVIRTKEEAEDIWEAYVDEVGQKIAREWLHAFTDYITGIDKNDNRSFFLKQEQTKAEQQANRKQGLAQIKK